MPYPYNTQPDELLTAMRPLPYKMPRPVIPYDAIPRDQGMTTPYTSSEPYDPDYITRPGHTWTEYEEIAPGAVMYDPYTQQYKTQQGVTVPVGKGFDEMGNYYTTHFGERHYPLSRATEPHYGPATGIVSERPDPDLAAQIAQYGEVNPWWKSWFPYYNDELRYGPIDPRIPQR